MKKHKITPRSCCLSAIMVLSSFCMLTISKIFHCDILLSKTKSCLLKNQNCSLVLLRACGRTKNLDGSFQVKVFIEIVWTFNEVLGDLIIILVLGRIIILWWANNPLLWDSRDVKTSLESHWQSTVHTALYICFNSVRPKPLFWFRSDTDTETQICWWFRPIP